MNSRNQHTEDLFRRYLDGELSDSEEQEILHLIADDPELRDMLRFERSLLRSYSVESEAASFGVPSGFADSVMAEIGAGSEKGHKQPAPVSDIRSVRRTGTGRILAAAAIALVSIGLGYLLAISQSATAPGAEQQTVTQYISDSESEIWMRFVYFDEEADQIEVAGDFSGWDPIELRQEMIGERRVWTGLVPLQRGEHRYMFIRDGEEWLTDPLADVQQDDGFGNKNAVIYL